MLLTAAGWPAGQRELNTASLIQIPVLLCTPRGRCFTPLPMLINFLVRHSSSFPAVTSSAPCPVALFLSNGEMFDIKMVCRGAKGVSLNPLSSVAEVWPGLVSAELSARVQPKLTVSLCLNPNTGVILSLPCWFLQQAVHMADMHCLGLRLGAGIPSLLASARGRSRWCQITAAGCSRNCCSSHAPWNPLLPSLTTTLSTLGFSTGCHTGPRVLSIYTD